MGIAAVPQETNARLVMVIVTQAMTAYPECADLIIVTMERSLRSTTLMIVALMVIITLLKVPRKEAQRIPMPDFTLI